VADQTPDFLQFLEREGIRPGVEIRVTVRNEAADTIELEFEVGRRVSLGYRAASKILVAVPVATQVE
jgi:Fe2+ transport system protein FeoA